LADGRRILLVDDEPQITRVLRTTITSQGYDVRVANDGETALEMMKDWTPDLVVTDLAMPDVDGLELCRRIRKHSQLPIIVLSVLGHERRKVEALDAGADDYVTKPFGMQELMARIRANLRRAPEADLPDQVIAEGHFRIDLAAHTVSVAHRDVRLTPKEFELLVYLAQRAGRVVTHRRLLGAVWGSDSVAQTEYLRVFVNRLRKKLEAAGGSERYIRTEPWIGYRFDPEGGAS
jgi:two-component system, OmpR family, KDP operon response regulator KdpE